MTTRPENLYEAASYDLNKFRERRITERRTQSRDTPDRRMSHGDIEQGRTRTGSEGEPGKSVN